MTEDSELPEHVIKEMERTIDIDITEYDFKELDPPDWLTELDRDILAILGETLMVLTPSVIAKNIDRSRSSVSRRLNTLEVGDMVEKEERGHYKISSKGHARMYQEYPPEIHNRGPDGDEWVSYGIPNSEEMENIEKLEESDEEN